MPNTPLIEARLASSLAHCTGEKQRRPKLEKTLIKIESRRYRWLAGILLGALVLSNAASSEGITSDETLQPEPRHEDIGALGYTYNVMWAVDSRGWPGLPATQIAQRCVDLAEPGAIYVFHVGSASEDGPALQSIIDGLRAEGYEITDLPGVLE